MDPLVLKKLAEEREEREKIDLEHLKEIENLINSEELKNLKNNIQETSTKANLLLESSKKLSDRIKKFFF